MPWTRTLIIIAILIPHDAYPALRSKDTPQLYYPVRLGTRLVYKWDSDDRTARRSGIGVVQDGQRLSPGEVYDMNRRD